MLTLLSRNKHLLRALSLVMSRLMNVQHLLYKGYSQDVFMIRCHVFMQCFQLLRRFFFNETHRTSDYNSVVRIESNVL